MCYTTSIILFLNCFSVKAQSLKSNFDDARAEAKRNGKSILIVFQKAGENASDIDIEKNILETKEFKTYVDQYLTTFKIDIFKQNMCVPGIIQELRDKHLTDRYNKKSIFPYFVIVDDKGRVLGEVNCNNSQPEYYINKLQSILNNKR